MLRMNATPSLDDLSALYLLRCEVEGKSAQTVRAYRETLGRFRRVVTVDDAAAVTPGDVYRYLGGFSHLSLETRHRYFREVRCFFNWLVDGRYLHDNPFRGIKNVRLPQRIVEPFSPADIAQLMAACDSATALGLRDRAMVLCLLDTGLRCSELVQLSLDDLDLDTRRLRVRHGKGNKQRVVPFAARCRAALKRYLEQRGTAPGPLFVAASHLGALKPATRAPAERTQADAAAPRATHWGGEGARAPLPSHLRDLGDSRTTRANSTCSTCSDTPRPTWCVATAPPTAQSRRHCATIASPRATR